MSLYEAFTHLRSVIEQDIFKPVPPEELEARRAQRVNDKDLAELEDAILEIAKDEADKIYRQLEEQYDYYMSDEGVAEELRGRETEFDVDPETGKLFEAKKEIFKAAPKDEVAKRKAAEKEARVKSGKVYFDDLDDEDKEKVIEDTKNDENYPGDWWYEDSIGHKWRDREGKRHETKGYFNEQLEEKGFENNEISFSGFYSQGDGACFECSLNVAKIIKHYKLDVRPVVKGAAADEMFYGKITAGGNYSHSNTMRISLEFEGYNESRKVNEEDEQIFKAASQEEVLARQPKGYATLNDAYPAGDTEIWYWRSTGSDHAHGLEADFMAGYDWCKKKGCLPDPDNLEKTHVLLGKVDLDPGDPGDEALLGHIYHMMQGETWSPFGEARRLIISKGLHHTSMSVGDIIKIGDKVWMVDNLGFIDLKNPDESQVSDSDPIEEAEEIFKAVPRAELEARPGWIEAERERERQREEREAHRRRVELRHLTRPDSWSLIRQWVNGSRDKGKAASLRVEGNVLFSYATPIAIREDDGMVHMVDQKFSVTTSKQQSWVRRAAGEGNYDMIPVRQFKQMLDQAGVYYSSSWLREANIFKPVPKKELEKRQAEREKIRAERRKKLEKRGLKVTYDVTPMSGRTSSFWYNGDVATIVYKDRTLTLTAQGEISVNFGESDGYFRRDDDAVDAAWEAGYKDADLYREDVIWNNNNWFEFWYESVDWDGKRDISVMENGPTFGSYKEAIKAGIDLIQDDKEWDSVTEHLIEESRISEADEGEIFKPAPEEELRARGMHRQFTKKGPFEYKFLHHIDDPDPDDQTWKVVGFGQYFDHETSEIFFHRDGDIEFNFYYETRAILEDNLELSDELTAERQAFDGTDEEWLESKKWTKEYSGYSGNEDPSHFWSNEDFGYTSFSAPDVENVGGGVIIQFVVGVAAGEPSVYLGDLMNAVDAMHQSDQEQDIASMFGYDHYENLIYDIKRYRGTLTGDEEREQRRPERIPGQVRFDFEHPGETFTESVNEAGEQIFKAAPAEEVKARRAAIRAAEIERKRARTEANKAFYASIPYTHEDIKKLSWYKKIASLENVTDTTSPIQKARRATAFTLTYEYVRSMAGHSQSLRAVFGDQLEILTGVAPYIAYANGYLRGVSGGETYMISKDDPAMTLSAYDELLHKMYNIISKRKETEKNALERAKEKRNGTR